ncbi:MAG: VOC family protein [Marinicaulis sp.]|nr:VOC family protein [Marinicaulis sp.]NNE41587.1 VOC family protein [Marinicaulis sp.]NNL90551.1 VOC family protein [Marinicaulis sp.]
MAQKISTYLMFAGEAEEAVNFYVENLDEASVNSIDRWSDDEPGPTGKVKTAYFTLCGQTFMAIDSPSVHEFSFTPSISLFVDCENEAQIDTLAAKFLEGGKSLMPLDNYGFSKKFAWLEDRYGVSWQFNLPSDAA